MLRLPHRQSDPTRGQDAPEVAMREDGNVSFQRTETGNHPVSAFGNLGGRFTTLTSVSKEIPVRSLRSRVVRHLWERRERAPRQRRVSALRARMRRLAQAWTLSELAPQYPCARAWVRSQA